MKKIILICSIILICLIFLFIGIAVKSNEKIEKENVSTDNTSTDDNVSPYMDYEMPDNVKDYNFNIQFVPVE